MSDGPFCCHANVGKKKYWDEMIPIISHSVMGLSQYLFLMSFKFENLWFSITKHLNSKLRFFMPLRNQKTSEPKERKYKLI